MWSRGVRLDLGFIKGERWASRPPYSPGGDDKLAVVARWATRPTRGGKFSFPFHILKTFSDLPKLFLFVKKMIITKWFTSQKRFGILDKNAALNC